jgi:hypothetical protein
MKKKIVVSWIFRLVFVLTGYAGTYSQFENGNVAPRMEKNRMSKDIKQASVEDSVKRNVRGAFEKLYPDAANVTWSTDDSNNPGVYFEWRGKVIRAAFNKRGQLLHSISTYGEDLLPGEVNLRIKESFFGKKISGVTEVYKEGKTAYLIALEDKTSWLTVKLLGKEMTVESVWLKSEKVNLD